MAGKLQFAVDCIRKFVLHRLDSKIRRALFASLKYFVHLSFNLKFLLELATKMYTVKSLLL